MNKEQGEIYTGLSQLVESYLSLPERNPEGLKQLPPELEQASKHLSSIANSLIEEVLYDRMEPSEAEEIVEEYTEHVLDCYAEYTEFHDMIRSLSSYHLGQICNAYLMKIKPYVLQGNRIALDNFRLMSSKLAVYLIEVDSYAKEKSALIAHNLIAALYNCGFEDLANKVAQATNTQVYRAKDLKDAALLRKLLTKKPRNEEKGDLPDNFQSPNLPN